MKRMLINATQKEELRIALVDGQYLYDLDIESVGHEQKKANIYKGIITKINPSLEAAFVSYGGERDGFLPLKDIADEYFAKNSQHGKRSIKDLKEGQEVLVQIEKEIRGKKGAALTTFISLAGSYMVLKPNDFHSGGISRHIQGGSRIALKRNLDSLNKPKGMSIIARTASIDKSASELQSDLDALVKYWQSIKLEAEKNRAPILIHKEIDVVTRVFRDHLRDDVTEILVDNQDVLESAKTSLQDLGRVEFLSKLSLYQGETSLFTHFQIENQIESAFQREVRLKSGGSIVIDPTEALTSIDINSAKSTKGADIEETAFNTNLEAAEEIARQLRFRDLGGLIVIDFIDMRAIKNQRAVEERLKESLKSDRARIQTARISRFGLLEMSRQRLSSSLKESTHNICPRCQGTGGIRDNYSLSLSILRLMQEEALKENTSQIELIVPVEIASYLLNEKRQEIAQIERNTPNVKIIIAPDQEMETPLYKLIRKRKGQEIDVLSYKLPKLIRELEEEEAENSTDENEERAVLSGVKVDLSTPNNTKKISQKQKKTGLLTALFSALKRLFSSSNEENKPSSPKSNNRKNNSSNRNDRNKPIANSPQSAARTNKSQNDKVKPTAQTDIKDNAVKSKQGEPKVHANETEQPVRVRREPRKLDKKIRLEPTAKATIKKETAAKKVRPKQIATLLMPVILDADAQNSGSTKNKNRRTSRHLRLNNQRRRKTNNGMALEFSPMPLEFAIVSPELALARVSIDYSLVHEHSNIDNNINSMEQKLAQIIEANDKAQKNATQSKSRDKTQAPIIPSLLNSVAAKSKNNMPTSANVLTDERKQTLPDKPAVSSTGIASSKMTKAPIDESTMNQELPNIIIRDESNYHYSGDAAAGGVRAKEHAGSGMTKPS